MHREMLGLQLERLQLIDTQIAKLNGMIAQAMKPHQEAVMRLAEVPGLGVDSAQEVIAEVGVQASTFPSAAELTSWRLVQNARSRPNSETASLHPECKRPLPPTHD
ncbi:MAG TPA: hypothetical protein VEV41_04420 [Terriglobales bacterium]|nr:hypothetical protein [Terriglobales bacterium]